MIWDHLAIGSDYFMATTKHLVTISKYSTTKTRLTTIYHPLTMTSRLTTIISYGNSNLKMHCEFANFETRWRININRTKYEIQF
jgi:microsomal dipeptidase-like Zn-dependent dipeptidase